MTPNGNTKSKTNRSAAARTALKIWKFYIFLNWISKFYRQNVSVIQSDFNYLDGIYISFCLFIWLILYSVLLFPLLPGGIGGGQPMFLSLFINSDATKSLNSIEIHRGEGALFQTESVCVAYQDDNEVIILRKNRILSLNLKETGINGLISLPGYVNNIGEPQCQKLALDWALTGYQSLIQNFRSEFSLLWNGSYIVEIPVQK
jgi:hypothetical protein